MQNALIHQINTSFNLALQLGDVFDHQSLPSNVNPYMI